MSTHFSVTKTDLSAIFNKTDGNSANLEKITFSNLKASPKDAQLTYHNPSNLQLYAKLLKTHKGTKEAHYRIRNALSAIDDFERKIFWAQYFNWIVDGLSFCGEKATTDMFEQSDEQRTTNNVKNTTCEDLESLFFRITEYI